MIILDHVALLKSYCLAPPYQFSHHLLFDENKKCSLAVNRKTKTQIFSYQIEYTFTFLKLCTKKLPIFFSNFLSLVFALKITFLCTSLKQLLQTG